MTLFRSQVVERCRFAPQAQPLQLASRRVRWLAGILLLGASAGISLLLVQTYAKKVSVSGFTEPTRAITKVFPAQVGRVQAVHVAEGQQVAAGARLVSLDLRRFAQPGHSLEQVQLNQLRQQLQEVRRRERLLDEQRLHHAADFSDQRRAHQALAPVLKQEQRLHNRQLRLLDERLAALQALLAKGAVTALQVNEIRAQRLELSQAGAVLAKQTLAHQSANDALAAREHQSQLQTQLQLSELRTTRLRIRQQLAQVQAARSAEILAPIAGQVSFLRAQPGDRVVPDRPLLNLVDPAPQQRVVLLIPASAAARVQTGQRISMRYGGLPLKDSPLVWGRLAQLSSSPVLPGEWQHGIAAAVSGPAYRAQVDVEPSHLGDIAPVPGLAVEADITLQSARVWQWLLRPLKQAWQRLGNHP